MSVAAGLRPPGNLAAGRPTALSLVLDQVGYSLRDLWRSRIALIFTFVLPLVWLVLIGLLAGNEAVDETTGVRIMQFVTPGAVVMGMLFATYPSVATSLGLAREQKILKRLNGTPLPAWAFLVGRAGGAALLAVAAVAVMLAVGVLAYEVQIVWSTVPATIVAILLGIASLTMLGLAVGVLAPSAASAQTFAMATAVAIPFLSGLFMVGANPPAWLDALGSLFPVRHLLTTLQDQFNPFLTGSGWDLTALAFIAAWGVAGLLAAVWGMRRETGTVASGARRPARTAAGNARDAAQLARPGLATLVVDQAGWATRGALRDFGSVFFAVALPVGLYALMATMYGQTDFRPQGRPFSFFFACGMAVYGVAVTAFINLPEAVATARDRLVLKRLRGTPLALWQYLAGRTAAAILIGLATAALVFAAAIALFAVKVDAGGVLLALGVALLGTLTFAGAATRWLRSPRAPKPSRPSAWHCSCRSRSSRISSSWAGPRTGWAASGRCSR
ncbi:MAG: ABC transporter permease [Chloroflexi bacterium]|nr:ABC transporter permease [Chloroflexota bacterium]